MISRWAILAGFLSLPLMAAVDHQEKLNRVIELDNISQRLPLFSVDGFKRALSYEKAQLSLEQRAQIETNLLAERIRDQVHTMYTNALEVNEDSTAAADEIKESIERDLTLIDPELQNEIRIVAMEALTSAQYGGQSSEVTSQKLYEVMLKSSQEKAEYLNFEGLTPYPHAPENLTNSNKDMLAGIQYKSTSELLRALVSNTPHGKWIVSASIDVSSAVSKKYMGTISYRFKTSFLGVSLDAGPVIAVKRELTSKVNIAAEDQYPILLSDGHFDLTKRDRQGRPIARQERYAHFTCEVALNFETDYSGGGGFSVMGVGGSANVSRTFNESVNLNSVRVQLPSSIGGKTVTISYLRNVCHNLYPNTKINSRMTVKQSGEIQMRNLLAGVHFSHPKTQCVSHNHCRNWFRKKWYPIVGRTAYPRCGENTVHKYRTCVVRSLRNQKCPVIERGRRTSRGVFEYPCDNGLKCVKLKSAGILTHSEGRCVPVNPRTYKAPGWFM